MEGNDTLSMKVTIAKLICWGLAIFDLILGGASVTIPDTVLRLFAPGREGSGSALLRRTGAVWLFFTVVQAWAAVNTGDQRALRAVSVLRLQEVGADPLWLASGEDFGWFGKFGLVFAPLFNLVTGLFLAHVASRLSSRSQEVR
jgi:hypothetical protein